MSTELAGTEHSHRDRVTVILAFLSSDACREACHEVVSPDRLAYEWCRLWFDEIYVPSLRYLDGLKGDRSEQAVEQFEACFASEEVEALERFHRFLELRVDRLSDEAHERERFPQTDAWDSVVRHAGYVLEDLEGVEPEEIRRQLTTVVRILIERSESTSEAAGTPLLEALTDTFRRPRLLQ